jgi:hypothetical protein
MTHELYHVVQRMARARVPGLDAKVFNLETAPTHPGCSRSSSRKGRQPMSSPSHCSRRPPSFAAPALRQDVARVVQEERCAGEDRGELCGSRSGLSGLRAGSMSWEQASDVLFYQPRPRVRTSSATRWPRRSITATDRHGSHRHCSSIQRIISALDRLHYEFSFTNENYTGHV